jgi:ankyrin repeat protein
VIGRPLAVALLVAASLSAQDTLLLRAAHDDNAKAVDQLVKAGADVKAANRYGVTALALACENGDSVMIERLLEAGADPNAALPGGETALMTAARTGRLDAVKALLAHGADVNAKESKRGQTALMWAAAEGHADVVEALIVAGADFHARLDSGFDAFLFAAREGKTDVIRALLRAGVDVNETAQPKRLGGKGPRAGSTALHLATGNAHFELAAFLVESGADPNAMGPGYAPLHMVPSVRKPGGGDNDPAPDGSGNMTSLQYVKFLADHGANLNARMTRKVAFGLTSLNTNGATPFLLASLTADAELMRLLAKLGADPKIPNADNATPLIAAAGLGTRSPGEDAGTESEVVEALRVALELGNDIDAVDNNGETAMHGAAYKNYAAPVEFLAAHGANIDIWNRPNKHGWTPLVIAQGFRFGNFKPSPVTVAAFAKVMTTAGVPVPDPPKRFGHGEK